MNRLLVILALLMLQVSVFAQTPYSFNYQAVVRDSEGKVMTDKVVDFAIDIILNSQAVYSETHTGIDTGTNGIVNFKIGEGTATSGSFTDIDWGAGAYKIRVTMNGELLGISNVTAVPIALYAVKSMDNPWEYNSGDYSLSYTKGLTEVQDLKINGSSDLSPEAGMIRYDVSSNDFIGYNGSEWKSLTEGNSSSESSSSLWSFNTENNSISYTDGLTELKDLKIYGSSNLSPEAGMVRFNTSSNDFEGYNGTEWKSLTATATNTTTTVVDTLWTVDAATKSISYTDGLTELKDLKISGSSNLSPEAGMIRFDNSTNDFQAYDGTAWKSMIAASTNTETTIVDTLWTVDATSKSITYNDGVTKVKDLVISGNSDATPEAGMIRYDADTKDFTGYTGSEWKSLVTAAAGTETTIVDTLWTVDSETKSISYTDGLTELKDLKISGSSNVDAEEGMIRFDSTTKDFVGYNGTEWKSMIADAGTETTVVDTLWTLGSEDKSISYTDGLTELKELRLSGNNDTISAEGMIRYDADDKDFLGYNGTEWKSLTAEASATTTGDYISTEAELKTAIENQVSNIVIDADFEITSPITIAYSLRMESLGAPKTISTKGTNAFTINASNVTIDNILFASSGGGVALSIESGLTDVTLSNLRMSAFERAIYKNGSAGSSQTSRLTFNNIKVLNSVNSGETAAVCILGNVDDLSIEDMTIDESQGKGIFIMYSCSGQLDRIKISNTAHDALTLAKNTTSESPTKSFSLANISINSTDGNGLIISESSATTSNVTVKNATGSGIEITGSSTDINPPVSLTNLNISGTKASGTNSYGIMLKGDATATISNFYITGTSTSAVDDQAVGVYALDSQNFIVNGGIFMKLGKLISVETSN
ncbi:right-handed parallel beta-helix repeat-containing protein [Mangrovibacterium diazotrophicum]|uniref:Parallel beta helix pectate lyase-like protein n=1 Tax=Mangrovibacterium diazotrophicum TaxID=1261403 RepID=A0A419WBT8_9BACT|nr:right-handed parallel beta-helix repeat-containing protein [Mangrovibacterium diazotrophicum]RKD92874.1 hypothetical protein BC643_3251 [Mangrovibacterium diazotrophicum]